MLWSGPFLPLAALIWPLLLGLAVVLPQMRPHALRLLPIAPLPALALALAGQADETAAPVLLLGIQLGLDESTRLLLGMTATVWLAAGIFAQSMIGGRNLALFTSAWCLTLTGNLGVFLAMDVITFYAAFAAVSLAAWFLVVHDRKPQALRAGRIYIVLAILGEVCLLTGFLIGVQAAQSLVIADIRVALAEAPLRAVAVTLLVAGFGIKAGMVPLHIWLPLAHPAAPPAASAVLSGAIVKAGLVGFWLFLPPGAFANGLMVLGFAGAFGAALWGLTQANPKAVLAYSTISQMGLMLGLIGGGAVSQVVALYAVHHGLAKGALFMAVAAVTGSTGRSRALLLAITAIVALSIAGFPLTGGGVVKIIAKSDLSAGLAQVVTFSGSTTALILGWFLFRLSKANAADASGMGLPRTTVILLALMAVFVPWLLWPFAEDITWEYAVSQSAVISGLWPLALAAVFGLAGLLMPSGQRVRIDRECPEVKRFECFSRWRFPGINLDFKPSVRNLPGKAFTGVEQALLRWRWSGVAAAVGVLLFALAMA